VAKIMPKGGKTYVIRWQKFVLRFQMFFVLHNKKYHLYFKNSICTAKIAIIHTFSGFGTLSELLAHFLGGMLLS
jgi:hypothetical protein